MNRTLLTVSVEEFIDAIKTGLNIESESTQQCEVQKHYVYGLQGIADLLGCSKATASRIKASGILDTAISQHGKVIVTDADLAIDIMKIRNQKRNLRGGYKL